MGWFKKVVFFGSHQDHYVPYHSARIQHTSDSLNDDKKGNKRGKVYAHMIKNILEEIEGPIIRLDINFRIPEQYLTFYIEI